MAPIDYGYINTLDGYHLGDDRPCGRGGGAHDVLVIADKTDLFGCIVHHDPVSVSQQRRTCPFSTVARRRTNRDETATYPVTGATIPIDEPHYHITIRKPDAGVCNRWEYDVIVVADGALGEFDAWLGPAAE